MVCAIPRKRGERIGCATGNPTFSRQRSSRTCSAIRARRPIDPIPTRYARGCYKILAEARAAQRLPWEATRASLYRTIFPQMTLWLPDDEGAQLRLEFETELERLKAA